MASRKRIKECNCDELVVVEEKYFFIRSLSYLDEFKGLTEALPGCLRQKGCAIVKPERTAQGQLHASFNGLGEHITHVYFLKEVLLWAMEIVLSRCPYLKVIQFAPFNKWEFEPRHERLVEGRGITVSFQKLRVKVARPVRLPKPPKEKKVVAPKPLRLVEKKVPAKVVKPQRPPKTENTFLLAKWFFHNLSPEQLSKFCELVTLGCPEAVWVYGTLYRDGQKLRSWNDLASKYSRKGFAKILEARTLMVAGYLGCDLLPATERVQQGVGALKRQACWLGAFRLYPETLKTYLAGVGLTEQDLPKGLKLWRLQTFLQLVQAERDELLDDLKDTDPRAYRVVKLRFGLENGMHFGQHLSYEQIGVVLSIRDEHEIRRLEKKGFEEIGIDE